MAMLRGIKFTTALAAFALFFLPWLDIQCSAKSLGTQTGIQTITGKATPSEEMSAKEGQAEQGEKLESATLVAAALFALALALACLLVSLLNNKVVLDGVGSALCGVALLCLLAQLGQGFPAKRDLIEQISTDQASNPMGMGDSLAFMMAANIQTVILPAFIATCILLGIPVLLMVSMFLVKPRAAKQRED